MIRIGFSTTNAPLSRLIRWLTKSAVSHTWLVYYDEDFGQDMVLEATLTGVRLVPYDVFKRHNKLVTEVRPVTVPLQAGLAEVGRWLGAHYDFGGLLGMAVVLLGRSLKRRWRNPLRSSRAMFCSELVAVALKASKYPGTDSWVPSQVDPDTLYKHVLSVRG